MSGPLTGLRIVVTRAEHQAEELAEPLRAQGAQAILLPVIGIGPPENPQPLEEAIAQIERYDWIIFTSTNGVRALGRHTCRARVAAVGAATRDFAERNGWTVDLTPDTYVVESLIEAFGTQRLEGQRMLLPAAAITRDVVREELSRRGALVDVIEAYRTVVPSDAPERAQAVFRVPFPDWITFASSSAVSNLTNLVPSEALRQIKMASIGPVTSKTIQEHQLTVTAEADPHDVPGLVAAIVHAVAPKTA